MGEEIFKLEGSRLVSYKRVGGETETLVVPREARAIGKDVFEHASFRHVRFWGEVETIEERAFYGCRNLVDIDLPKGLESIGASVFDGCESLRKIDVSDGVKSIGAYAFAHCISLKKITIPRSVTEIDSSAFVFTKSLSEIEVDEGNERYKSSDGSLYTRDVKELVHASGAATEFEIPEGICAVSDHAFESSDISSVKMPAGVESIGRCAFSDCRNLKTVEIPDSVTHIGERAFFDSALEYVRLSESLTSIEKGTFELCYNLKDIVIPFGVKRIGNGAFSRCYALEHISVPEGVKTIEADTFMDCEKLSDIVLPRSLESVGFEAFDGCCALKTVYYLGTKEEWERISVGFDNDPLSTADIYFYSKDEPDGDGRCWRFVDGKAEAWTK